VKTLTLSSGRVIPTRWVGEQHVREDLGFIPGFADWARSIRVAFMAERLGDGQAFLLLNVLDDFNREGLQVKFNTSLPAERMIRGLDRIIESRGKPGTTRVDNGPAYISTKLLEWAKKHGVAIQPGQLQQNAYIERYNRTVQHEWLDQ
jgi:putative transposase